MDDGVGRQGYRVLTGVFAGIGLVGLVTAIFAFRMNVPLFQGIGVTLMIFGIGAMLLITLTILNRPEKAAPVAQEATQPVMQEAPRPATPAPAAKPAPQPARPGPTATVAVRPRKHTIETAATPVKKVHPAPKVTVHRGPRYEKMKVLGDAKEVTGPFKGRPQPMDDLPAPRVAPEKMELPEAFNDPEPVPWPQRRGPSGVLAGQVAARAQAIMDKQVPVVMAKMYYPQDRILPGWKQGRCGECGTQLVAPPERPINLRCPHCDKLKVME